MRNTSHQRIVDAFDGGHDHGHGHDHEHAHGDDHIHPAPSHFLTKYVFSTDHKVIGIQFLFSGLIFFVIGGLLAMAVRWQLAWPWKPVPILSRLLWSDPSLGYQMPPEFYNKLFTMHATIMIFFVIIPALDRGVRQFPDPAHDRSAGHGVSQAEHVFVLVHAAGDDLYHLFVFRGGRVAGSRLDELSALDDLPLGDAGLVERPDVLAAGAPLRRDLVALGLDQLHHDDRDAACARG